jgi:F-type H+-transporting ATPase subunit alpha
MKQKQYSPLSVAQMGVSLFAANEGYLKNVEIKKILDFEAALHSFMGSEYGALMNNINATGDFSKETAAALKEALDKFVATQAW